jgi:GT2 family glycosyltransferase
MKKIPVIIPVYRGEEELGKCISALEEQSYKPIEIFIRDNNKDNVLFTAAVNEGLTRYSYSDACDYVLVLNQDAYVEREALTGLVRCMELNPGCGIACPIQLAYKNGPVNWGGSQDAFPFGKHLCRPVDSYQKDFETYWANGAAMLLRTSMIREIGLLDKNMRFICSDSDYSFTARSRGWKIIVAVESRVYHSAGSSRAIENDFLDRIKIRDVIYFADKWLTGGLYRGLSLEGPRLSDADIRLTVDNFKRTIGEC